MQEVGDAQTPITLRTDDGLHVSIHEAALVDYSGMNLTRVEQRRFRAMLTPGIGDGKVVRTAPSGRRGAPCRYPTTRRAWPCPR